MKESEFIYKPFGKQALLIEWPAHVDEKILNAILSLQSKIEDRLASKIVETVNTYHTLTIFFKTEVISFTKLVAEIKMIAMMEISTKVDSFIWQIPVCYDLEFGIDLEVISKARNLSIREIIDLHSQNEYTVYFTGFLPGFLYLGGLSDKLFIPRKETPRSKILKGAVAIGGSQTGIYTQESPGGWNIIGNSPVSLFNPRTTPPCKIKAGDKVKFSSITKEEHSELLKGIEHGSCEVKLLANE